MKKTLKVSRTSTKVVEIEVEIPDNELAKTPFMRMHQFRDKASEQGHEIDFDFNRGAELSDLEVLPVSAKEWELPTKET